MTFLPALILLSLMTGEVPASQDVNSDNSSVVADFDSLYQKTKFPVNLKIGKHTLKITGQKDIILSGDDPNSSGPSDIEGRDIFTGTYYVTFDGNDLINDVYCKVDGNTEEIHYSSSNQKIATVSNHEDAGVMQEGLIQIHGTGKVTITVSLGEKSVQLPLRILTIPVRAGISTDDMIKQWGLPDKRTSKSVDWPDHATIDGIYYYPTVEQDHIVTEHWFYKKFPRIVFVVDGGKSIDQIHDMGW